MCCEKSHVNEVCQLVDLFGVDDLEGFYKEIESFAFMEQNEGKGDPECGI